MTDAEYTALKADMKAAGWLAGWPSSPEQEDEKDGQGDEKDGQWDKDEGRVEEHKSIIPSHAWHAVLNWEDGDELVAPWLEEEEEGLSQATTIHLRSPNIPLACLREDEKALCRRYWNSKPQLEGEGEGDNWVMEMDCDARGTMDVGEEVLEQEENEEEEEKEEGRAKTKKRKHR